jgi:uncharacterized membrane protein YfcA
MEIVGYITAILIGLSLGLIGGGGSIITVPVLVYLLKVDVELATMYSLFVVGSCSMVGSVRAYRKEQVNTPVVFVFGGASMLSVFMVRHLVVPRIPAHLFSIGAIDITKGRFLMVLFALLMLLRASSMVRSRAKLIAIPDSTVPRKMLPLFLQGVVIGAVTGLLGAGGGFLIIPALVLFGKLPMKVAVGSSLTIMAFSSLFGFFSTLSLYVIQWPLLISFTAIAIGGIFIGSSLSDKIPGHVLKKVFGWFVLAMAAFIIFKEFFLTHS